MTRSLPQGLQRTSSSQSTTNKSIPLDLNRRPAEITFQPASFADFWIRRLLRLHGEAARLLGSQKSRRFCRIAKSPTSFDPVSIASGYRQPLMSAPASVPRVARPSEATAFAVPHTSLISSSSCFVLFPQLRTRHSSRYYRLSKVSFWCPQQGLLLGTDVGSPFGGLCRVSFR